MACLPAKKPNPELFTPPPSADREQTCDSGTKLASFRWRERRSAAHAALAASKVIGCVFPPASAAKWARSHAHVANGS